MSERYGTMLSMLFTLTLYSGGMPFLSWFAVIFFFTGYWCEKIAFLRVFQTPPSYDEQLPMLATALIPYAAMLHMSLSLWAVSYYPGAKVDLPGMSTLPIPDFFARRIFKIQSLPILFLLLTTMFFVIIRPLFAVLTETIANAVSAKSEEDEEALDQEVEPTFFEALENNEISGLETLVFLFCGMCPRNIFYRYNIKKNPAYKEAFASNTEVVAADD